MRLLYFGQAGKLLSTDFSGKTIPPYAILSHRWGDSEVLFRDIVNGRYKEKEGYRKIKLCAEQAAKDQLQYFWVDTCCIDKWNLHELSRSINSMFRWYKDAKRCYVFLPDVSVPTTAVIAQQSNWEVSFRASEWFRRGWTLQELIAPESVEFFSLEGQCIGDKRSLEQLVHEISDVPIEALQGCSLEKFTIRERIEWAKNRETTEEEDIVYCLLGILDVSMPTSYGEGRKGARIRLEAELNNSAPFLVPFSRNNNFVGRESQLAKLEERLFKANQTAIVAIAGPGGTGKSQLALELAYRTRQQNKGRAVFWVNASSVDEADRSFMDIAQKLKIPGWDDEKADVRRIVKLHLSSKDTAQSLLIFDNADSINPSSNRSSNKTSMGRDTSLVDYLPQTKHCSILLTTTNINAARTLASYEIIELQEMEQDTAQSMLERYLDNPVSKSEQQHAKLLLQELSHLPLAIVQAAAYINIRSITLQDYRIQLSKQHQEVVNSKLQEYDTDSSVATTLHLSLEQIRHESPLAAEYLFFAACVDRKDILLEFLEAPSSREREDAIQIINSYKLITRRPAESALDLHRLVHGALREWIGKREMLGEWAQAAIARLCRLFPDNSHGNRSMWRRMLPHAKYALSHSDRNEEGTEKAGLARKCAEALLSDGKYNEAETLCVQVMETSSKVLGVEHPDTLTSMANLASTYRNQGRWNEAEELEVRVIETRKRVLGNEHLSTLTSMVNLASTYRNQGRWKEAEELQVRVIETRKRVLGDEHPNTLTSMANLALTYWNQGRWKEAEELQVRVIETRKRVLGGEHPSTLTSMASLALTYRNQGRWKEAEELFVRVIGMRKRVLGDEHPDTLTSMANLALTYSNQGRWKEAEELQVTELQVCSRVLGDEHPSTLTSMANLGSTYWNQGRWKEAEDLEMRVIEMRKRGLGDEHPDTLTSMANLASTYKNQGRWNEAEELEVRVIETSLRVLGDEHPNTLTSMANLGSTYWNQGRWKEAEDLEMRVIEIRKRVLGDEHPDTLTSMGNLALTYSNQG